MQSPGDVAVLLNRNAKRVSSSVIKALGEVAGSDLYVTDDLREAHEVALRVVERRYRTVLVGGGDGTFVEWTSEILRLAGDAGAPAPRFAVLPLGTGNALATALGADSPEPWALRRTVRRARNGAPTRRIDLLEVEGRLTPFAGFGMDAAILADHDAVERALSLLRMRVGANASYALSLLLRSIPRYALPAPHPEVTITNIGRPAIRLDVDGRPTCDPIPAGDVLYRGRASIASASTIPNVGLSLRLFPHADCVRGRFQLRIADAGVLEILGHLPALWRGTYRSESITDYLCTGVLMETRPAAPFQVGGDVMGRLDRVAIDLAQGRVRVLS